jgi:hypothetical protein
VSLAQYIQIEEAAFFTPFSPPNLFFRMGIEKGDGDLKIIF